MCNHPNCTLRGCEIEYGKCHCGCGEDTALAKMTRSNLGWRKGEPMKYVKTHHFRGKGSAHPSWKGGRTKTKSGYWLVAAPHHPMADANGNVLEHRLVMSGLLGRKLLRSEHVHHKNGVRDDNRLENLEILSNRDHMRKNSRLTASDVAIIRRRLLNGEKQKALAEAYGISHAAISFIATGKSWPGVEAA